MRPTSPSTTADVDGASAEPAHRVAGGAAVALAGGGLSLVLSTAYQVVIARQLGSAGFGLFVLALAVSSFLAEASDLGLDYGVLRFAGIAHGARDTGRFRAVVARALVGTLAAGAAAAALLAGGGGLVARIFGKPELESVLLPLAIAVPCTGTAEVARASLRALGRALPSVASDSMLAPSLRLTTGAWAVAEAPSPRAAALAYAGTEAAVLAVTLAMVWRALPRGGHAWIGAEPVPVLPAHVAEPSDSLHQQPDRGRRLGHARTGGHARRHWRCQAAVDDHRRPADLGHRAVQPDGRRPASPRQGQGAGPAIQDRDPLAVHAWLARLPGRGASRTVAT
jgi:hypothetical protein